jgi:hypothetical protein
MSLLIFFNAANGIAPPDPVPTGSSVYDVALSAAGIHLCTCTAWQSHVEAGTVEEATDEVVQLDEATPLTRSHAILHLPTPSLTRSAAGAWALRLTIKVQLCLRPVNGQTDNQNLNDAVTLVSSLVEQLAAQGIPNLLEISSEGPVREPDGDLAGWHLADLTLTYAGAL